MIETDVQGVIDVMEEAQKKIVKVLKEFVQKIEIQIEDLNKRNLKLDSNCQKLTVEQTELTLEIATLKKDNNKLSKKNDGLKESEKDAKRETYGLREKLRGILKEANGLTDKSVAKVPVKLDCILLSGADESKRAKNILGDLEKKFPDIEWELLVVPSRKKSLKYADLIICSAQLFKNHKDTDWVENEAKKNGVQIIRPQGGSTQIELEISKFMDDLDK